MSSVSARAIHLWGIALWIELVIGGTHHLLQIASNEAADVAHGEVIASYRICKGHDIDFQHDTARRQLPLARQCARGAPVLCVDKACQATQHLHISTTHAFVTQLLALAPTSAVEAMMRPLVHTHTFLDGTACATARL